MARRRLFDVGVVGFVCRSTEPDVGIVVGLFALLPVMTGVGLWRMRKWGWWLVVITQSLGLVGALFNLLSGLLLSAIVTGVVSGGILYWFINSRQMSLGPFTQHTSVGAEGELVIGGVPKLKSNNSTIVVIGIALAVFLVPVCIIVVLNLTWAEIGEVFSRIVNELSATPVP